MTTLSIIAPGSRVKTSRCKGRVQRQILQPRITFSSLEIHWHVRWQTGKHRVSSNCTISVSLTYKSVEMQKSMNQKTGSHTFTKLHVSCLDELLHLWGLWLPGTETLSHKHTHTVINEILTASRLHEATAWFRVHVFTGGCVWEGDNSEQHTHSQTLLTCEDKTEHVTADNSDVSFCTFNLVFQ